MSSVSASPNWGSRVLSHVGGMPTVKNIGKDAGIAALFAIGGYLTRDDGPLKDASPNTKKLVNAVFGVPMFAKLTVPELVSTWKEREVPDFVMHALTATIGVLGATTNDHDMITSAAMLATLFAMAGHLEEGVQAKSLHGIEELKKIVPEEAMLQGASAPIKVDDIKIDDHVLVKSGETLPVDGIVHDIQVAEKKVDLGAVTMPKVLDGEGKQIAVTIGHAVPQGAVAADGTQLVVKTKALASESALSRNIAYLTEESAEGAAKSVKGIEQNIKNIYVPIMLAACAAQFALSYYKDQKKHKKDGKQHAEKASEKQQLVVVQKDAKEGDKKEKHEDNKKQHGQVHSLEKSVKRTAELAIKMAPCAIMASTLVIPFVKNALASSHGVMIREEAALEKMKNITHVLSDIRGTLTKGVSEFKGLHLWDGAKLVAHEEPALLGMLGKAQTASTHELAASVREAAAKAGHDLRVAANEKVSVVAGKGVVGELGEHHIIMGGKELFADHGHLLPSDLLTAADAHGGDVSFFRHLHEGKERFGIASFKDELRAGAKEAIEKLRASGKKISLVTGMPEKSAKVILEELQAGSTIKDNSIELFSNCASTKEAGRMDKVSIADGFLKDKNVVAAIGDAGNDAAFMAHVKNKGGVAMAIASTGASATKDAASVVIEGIHQLPDLMTLSKRLNHALWLNVGAAGAWMAGLIGSHVAGHHMKTQTASIAHEAPTFLLTLAGLAQSMHLVKGLGAVGRA